MRIYQWSVAGLLAVGLTAAGLSNPRAADTAPVHVRGQTGEAVFRGVFFGEGEVGNVLPEEIRSRVQPRAKLAPDELLRVTRARDEIMAKLRATEPAFFDRFGAEMRSGNHLRVRAALQEAAQRVAQVQSKEPALNDADRGRGLCLIIAAYRIVVVYVDALVGKNLAFWTAETDAANATTLGDQLVDALATGLS